MGDKPATPFFIGTLITSAVGAILLLATDFGGWYFQLSYGGAQVDRYGSVGLMSVYFPIVLVFAGLLLYGAYVSYLSLRPVGAPPPRSIVRRAYFGSVGAFVAMLVLALAFTVIMVAQDLDDWWLDTGFYGGAIGSGLSALLLRLGLKHIPS